MQSNFIADKAVSVVAVFARIYPGRLLVSWVMQKMVTLDSNAKLFETETLLAFYHPRPVYPFHVLITPKKPIKSLAELGETDLDFISDLLSYIQSLVAKFSLEKTAYRLIVNGGEFQEFPYLHFHLISDKNISSA
jgi:histidine triad (HIT) family protein